MALAIGTGTPPLPSRDAEQGAACLRELFQQKPSTAPCIPRLCPHRQRCLHRHGKGRTEAPGAFAARCLEGRKLQWDFFLIFFSAVWIRGILCACLHGKQPCMALTAVSAFSFPRANEGQSIQKQPRSSGSPRPNEPVAKIRRALLGDFPASVLVSR